jgi:hypothetical protein
MKLSCPFCNHVFTADQAPPLCPRCGEPLSRAAAVKKARAEEFDLGPMVKSRMKVAMLIAVGIIAVMVAVAFWKVAEERKKNQFPPGMPLPASAAVVPPLELRGLQYLPSNCNVVLALQPGPLAIHAERLKQNPADALAKIKFVSSALAALGNASITLQDIDHIAAGLYVPDRDEEPRISLVLVLRQMRDEPRFLAGLKAKPTPTGYDVSFDKFSPRMKRLSATEWAFGLSEKDFAEGSSLSPSMRDVVTSRVPRGAALWVAASGEKWNEKPLVKLLGKDVLGDFAKWNAFAVGLEFGDDPRLSLAVKAADPATAEQLRTRFKAQATGEKSRSGGDGDWATLEKPVDPLDFTKDLKAILDTGR